MEPPNEIKGSDRAEEFPGFITFRSQLRKTEPIYARLMHLKEKGWKGSKGNEYFSNRQQRADGATTKEAANFYVMMKQIGDEMQEKTSAFTQVNRVGDDFRILDLCMAPGGYTASALKFNFGSRASGITLPATEGGHEVFLNSPRSVVKYKDITIFSTEFGAEEVPITHPARQSFSTERPFYDQRFDLVICDGQVLRIRDRPDYRETNESTRLTTSQLILALQRIRQGGTLIMLLHRIDGMESIELLYTFSRFSDVEVFKPLKKHGIKSSFYMIAKNIQPDGESAKEAVMAWKKAWWNATFGGEKGTGAAKINFAAEYVQTILDNFGSDFVSLAKPIWKIQADALSKSDFMQ